MCTNKEEIDDAVTLFKFVGIFLFFIIVQCFTKMFDAG